jgi:hypothetical protein
MDALCSLVQPLVVSGTVEVARRVSSSAWNHFVNCELLTFFILATLAWDEDGANE